MELEGLIRLTLAYNGETFHGWQSQPSGRGVQDALESCLAVVLRGAVRVTSASRTDTGVHAEYQVVTFRGPVDTNCHRLVRSLNALLPASIRIRDALIVDGDFHPIRSARAKIYRYRLWRSIGITPFVAPYVWQMAQPLDVESMRSAAKFFVGRHDFTSFCAADSSAKSKVRNVREISIIESGPLIDFWFLGEGFLKQMIRIIVGTVVSAGLGKLAPDSVPGLLAAVDRRVAPGTAPASGLCLVKVCYAEIPQLIDLLEDSLKGYNVSLSGEWMGLS